MKRAVLPILVTAVLASAALAGTSSISWKKGYPAAISAAKSSGKLIMVDFYTDWCGWCKKLDSDTYPAPAVVKESEKFVPIKLDAEKDADGVRLAKKFGITGYPTILFLDGNENLAYKVVGYEPAKDFAVSMQKAASIREDSAKYKAALKSNPNDFDALVGSAGIEASMGDFDSAAVKVEKAAKAAPASKKGKLLDAYNAVGDGYQGANQLEKAVGFFAKAIAPGFDSQAAYARVSIGVCYMQLGKPEAAKPYLEALLKQSNAPKEYTDQAKQILQMMKH